MSSWKNIGKANKGDQRGLRKTSQGSTNLKTTNEKLTFKDGVSEDRLCNEAKNKTEM